MKNFVRNSVPNRQTSDECSKLLTKDNRIGTDLPNLWRFGTEFRTKGIGDKIGELDKVGGLKENKVDQANTCGVAGKGVRGVV